MHKCRTCGFRFEDAEALRRHEEEGRGCTDYYPNGGRR